MQKIIQTIVKCGVCEKSDEMNCLSDFGYGDSITKLPDGWFFQTDGDYCGGRWISYFCSEQCAQKAAEYQSKFLRS